MMPRTFPVCTAPVWWKHQPPASLMKHPKSCLAVAQVCKQLVDAAQQLGLIVSSSATAVSDTDE
jgi:hypothetical protein